jgi:hypothetical protein
MKELTLRDRCIAADSVVSRELDGEMVLLNLDTGIYFGLDAVGSDMWRAMLASASLGDAASAVEAEYEIAADEVRDDLLRLANQMLAKGLVRSAAV